MNIGNINTNISSQQRMTGKKVKSDSFNTKDVFTPSGGESGSLKNAVGTMTAKDAGKILMGMGKDANSAREYLHEGLEWRQHGGVYAKNPPVFDDGNFCLYAGVEEKPETGRHNHWLTRFNPDGTVKWKYTADELREGPVLDKKGNAYFCGMNDLHAINSNGEEIWSAKLENLYCTGENPVISPDGTVFAINTDYENKDNEMENTQVNAVKDGKVLWTYHTMHWGDTNSMLMGKDGTLYLAAGKNVKEKGFIFSKDNPQKFFIGLNPDGSEKFKVPVTSWGKRHYGCLAQGPDGTVYTIQENRRLVAYSPDGKEIFNNKLTASSKQWGEITLKTEHPPAIDKDGNVLISTDGYHTNDLICFDKDGKEQWRKSFKKKISTKAHFSTDGKIVVGLTSGKVHILDKEGKTQKKFLVKSGLHKNPFYDRIDGDEPIIPVSFAFDGEGRMFVASYDWVSSYNIGEASPEKVTENLEGQKNISIKMKEETVVIGGVTLKKNRNSTE